VLSVFLGKVSASVRMAILMSELQNQLDLIIFLLFLLSSFSAKFPVRLNDGSQLSADLRDHPRSWRSGPGNPVHAIVGTRDLDSGPVTPSGELSPAFPGLV
jgi:hypothetical protein